MVPDVGYKISHMMAEYMEKTRKAL